MYPLHARLIIPGLGAALLFCRVCRWIMFKNREREKKKCEDV